MLPDDPENSILKRLQPDEAEPEAGTDAPPAAETPPAEAAPTETPLRGSAGRRSAC